MRPTQATRRAKIDLLSSRIVKTGGKDLALELEAKGYAAYQDAAA